MDKTNSIVGYIEHTDCSIRQYRSVNVATGLQNIIRDVPTVVGSGQD